MAKTWNRCAVRIVRRATAPAAFPLDQHDSLRAPIMAGIAAMGNLNPPRRYRTYPRVIKRARHNSYRVKRAGDRGTTTPGAPIIKLANLHRLSPVA